jgi:hypothetical protein
MKPIAVVAGGLRYELVPRPVLWEYTVAGVGRRMSLDDIVRYAAEQATEQRASEDGAWVAKEQVHVLVVFEQGTEGTDAEATDA